MSTAQQIMSSKQFVDLASAYISQASPNRPFDAIRRMVDDFGGPQLVIQLSQGIQADPGAWRADIRDSLLDWFLLMLLLVIRADNQLVTLIVSNAIPVYGVTVDLCGPWNQRDDLAMKASLYVALRFGVSKRVLLKLILVDKFGAEHIRQSANMCHGDIVTVTVTDSRQFEAFFRDLRRYFDFYYEVGTPPDLTSIKVIVYESRERDKAARTAPAFNRGTAL